MIKSLAALLIHTLRIISQKEPKLARARQIPEWEEYDGEIARFARKLAEQGLIRSSIATAGADALAGGSGPVSAAEGVSVDDNDSEVKEVKEEDAPTRDEL